MKLLTFILCTLGLAGSCVWLAFDFNCPIDAGTVIFMILKCILILMFGIGIHVTLGSKRISR